MPQPIDPALNTFVLGMLLLSFIAGMHVLATRKRGTVLPYEPRQPVPWGPVGCVLAVMLLLFVGIAALGGDSAETAAPVDINTPKPPSSTSLIAPMLAQFGIVAAVLFFVAAFSKATTRDLGLPANRRQLIGDMSIGAAACLAALAPVHIVQLMMLSLFFPEKSESGHPIIKLVMESPDPFMLILTGVATVVIAPICEEVTFRLLLQGWLERWEDERLGWRHPAVEALPISEELQSAKDDQAHPEVLPFEAKPSLPDPEPPQRGVFGLPYGWFPIIVSAVAFGLAHYGYGPEPIPISLLGMVLGFLYQRTHRLVPSIVAHSLFNLFTMIILWRMIYYHH